MPTTRTTGAFRALMDIARRLRFEPHRIGHLLDARGRHEIELPLAFPFVVSLFRFRAGATTQRLTWHERVELLIPLDGPMTERMGDLEVELEPGDLLVVDHLKPHQVVDSPGLNTRVIVISFLSECAFAPGSPPTDYAFLIPFHREVEGKPRVMRRSSSHAGDVYEAIAKLLACHFDSRAFHREAGCKAWLLVLLHGLIQAFRDSEVERSAILRRQEAVSRLQPVLEHVRVHFSETLSLKKAAAMCAMNPALFRRVFKQSCGMTLLTYLHHVRMAHAVERLEESTDPISTIALELGFSDQSHFDRRFRRMFGKTPTEYRRKRGAGVREGVNAPLPTATPTRDRTGLRSSRRVGKAGAMTT